MCDQSGDNASLSARTNALSRMSESPGIAAALGDRYVIERQTGARGMAVAVIR
jgi:hypothetical protein